MSWTQFRAMTWAIGVEARVKILSFAPVNADACRCAATMRDGAASRGQLANDILHRSRRRRAGGRTRHLGTSVVRPNTTTCGAMGARQLPECEADPSS